MSKLQPGDICEILPGGVLPDWARHIVGRHCTLIERFAEDFADVSGPCWRVELDGGCGWIVSEPYLRKIPPDDGREVSSWDRCVWRPKGVTC